MEFFKVFLVILLLLQVFAEASSNTEVANSLESTYEGIQGSQAVALNSKHVQLHKISCNRECSRRCSKALKRKRCKRACKSCCYRCHCVPPGTYGHKELCPCYARLRTHGNNPKCP